jgi:hypothetical protein
MDFVSDALFDGRRIRALTLVVKRHQELDPWRHGELDPRIAQ